MRPDNKSKLSFTALLLLTIVVVASAQPGPPANPVPLDGGISLLFAAGAAIGVKKLFDIRNKY